MDLATWIIDDTHVLSFLDSPVFLNRPANTAGVTNERVTLTCKVDSNPPPLYSWFHAQQTSHVISHSANLTFMVKETTVGAYVCRASVPGYSDISAQAQVFLKGPPKIDLSNRIQYSIEGDSAKVRCKAISVPEAKAVTWTKANGQHVQPGVPGGKYSVVERNTVDGIESTLILKKAESEDFGSYVCTVTNEFGSDSSAIHLRKQSKKK